MLGLLQKPKRKSRNPRPKRSQKLKKQSLRSQSVDHDRGYARLKARHQAVIHELEELKRQRTEPVDETKVPKVEDYNGDYLAFERATVAYEARQAIRDELSKARQVDQQAKLQEAQAENLDEFFEKWNDLEQQMPDAKDAVDKLYATIGPLNPVARDLLADADNGEVILYYLAKNPGLARQLNGMDPLSMAKEIGKLEAKTALPKTQTETKAPPPISGPKGGASPPRNLEQLAKRSEDISDYVKARQAKRSRKISAGNCLNG